MDTHSRRKKLIKLLIIIGVIALVAALVWFAFGNTLPQLFRLLRHGDRAEIRQYLAGRSQWKGIVCTIMLAILQVVSIVFPGLAIQIAAGVIYGWWKSFFICYVGFVIGNVVVFMVARHLGSSINELAGKQTAKHSKNFILRKLRTLNPTLMVALGYLLPLVPNGIIPYISANTKISLRRFTAALALTSWFQIFFNCLAGNFLLHGRYFMMVLMFVIQGAMFVFVCWKGGLFNHFKKTNSPALSEDEQKQAEHSKSDAAYQQESDEPIQEDAAS